jgi:hypothetical protein
LNKEFARRFVIPASVIIVVIDRYLAGPQRDTRGPGFATQLIEGETKMYKMQKTILTAAAIQRPAANDLVENGRRAGRSRSIGPLCLVADRPRVGLKMVAVRPRLLRGRNTQ